MPSLSQHLRNHALFPLQCAYEGEVTRNPISEHAVDTKPGCDASFASAAELSAHHKLPGHVGDALRPQVAFVVPPPATNLLPELTVVPTFTIGTLRVQQHEIGQRLHEWLAPKV